jgi:ABC-type glycerol-3-phosphate transport system permease component
MKRSGIGAVIVVVTFCALAVAPLLWHGISSLKTGAELTRIPPDILPEAPTLANYHELFARRPFSAYFLNSFVIASLATVICLTAGSLAAYRLIHLPPRVGSALAGGLLLLSFFPPIVFLFPIYEVVQRLGGINHPWSLILVYAGLNLPLTIWLLSGYLRRIPRELEEAAAIDGMTEFQAFRLVLLPLAVPALVATGILVFIFCWNEFMFALTFMNLDRAKTLTVGVATLSGAFAYEIPWGLLAAGVIVSAVPLIVLVLLFQKWIVQGLTAGAIK